MQRRNWLILAALIAVVSVTIFSYRAWRFRRLSGSEKSELAELTSAHYRRELLEQAVAFAADAAPHLTMREVESIVDDRIADRKAEFWKEH